MLNPLEFMTKMESRMLFNNEDKKILSAHADWGEKIAPAMAEKFYNFLGSDPEMNTILNESEQRINRLRKTFIEWFSEMFTGIDNWGKSYAQRRWHIGLVHVRLGIGPQHVVPAMATVVNEANQLLMAEDQNNYNLQQSLNKICMIDLAFIEQAYVEIASQSVLQETGWSERLFKRLITTGAGTIN